MDIVESAKYELNKFFTCTLRAFFNRSRSGFGLRKKKVLFGSGNRTRIRNTENKNKKYVKKMNTDMCLLYA